VTDLKKIAAQMVAVHARRTGRRSTDRSRDRLDMDERDILEPDELELWMAEQLHDWQLINRAAIFESLGEILASMEQGYQDEREAARGSNDLRREGYADGEINAVQTIRQQLDRAIAAALDRVGETVDRKKR